MKESGYSTEFLQTSIQFLHGKAFPRIGAKSAQIRSCGIFYVSARLVEVPAKAGHPWASDCILRHGDVVHEQCRLSTSGIKLYNPSRAGDRSTVSRNTLLRI
jgi:hypothetical protein